MRKRAKKSPHRQIGKIIRKLRISDGDVLLIRRDSDLAKPETIDQLGRLFEKHYPHLRCVFVVVDKLDDIAKADDQVMRDNGWIRWPRGKKALPIGDEDES